MLPIAPVVFRVTAPVLEISAVALVAFTAAIPPVPAVKVTAPVVLFRPMTGPVLSRMICPAPATL